jgi:hypothetical protein
MHCATPCKIKAQTDKNLNKDPLSFSLLSGTELCKSTHPNYLEETRLEKTFKSKLPNIFE